MIFEEIIILKCNINKLKNGSSNTDDYYTSALKRTHFKASDFRATSSEAVFFFDPAEF